MANCDKTKLFPFEHEKKKWPDFLLIAGLFIFSIASNFSISASQIGLSLALIGMIALIKNKKVMPRKTPLDIPFACFVLAGLFSLFYAEELLRAIGEIRKFLIVFVFYIGFWPRMKEKFQKQLLGTFIIFSTLVSAIGIIKLKFFDVGLERVYGFFSLPTTFGECQALAALVVVTWFCAAPAKKKTYLFLGICLTIIITGLLMSYTRGAWVGFSFGFLSLVVRFPRKLIPVALMLVVAVFVVVESCPMMKERFASMSVQKNLKAFHRKVEAKYDTDGIESNFRRLRNWQLGFTIVENMPIFGVGMNNVKNWYKKTATQFERENKFIFGHQHNDFMQMLVMTGLFGLTMFLWFLVSTAKFLVEIPDRIDSECQEKISRGAIAILFCFIATGLTEYSWGDEEVAMLAFFLMGLMANPVELRTSCESE